jgi:uncharacterized damage-inducible protein DinB
MSIAHALVAELDHELNTTRASIAAIPEAKAAWKPHAKSMSLGALAMHIIDAYAWGVPTVTQDSFDVAPGGVPAYKTPDFTTTAAAIADLDTKAAAFRAVLATTSDAAMMQPWSLLANGHALFTMPRVVTLRSFIFNHSVHHRGQLSVYLRLLDVKLPEVYGPTADSPKMM